MFHRLHGVVTALVWMQTKRGELFAQRQARNAQPTGGFGLVAFRQRDGLSENFAFSLSDDLRVRVADFTALSAGQQRSGE
jgi:hypothetical protein